MEKRLYTNIVNKRAGVLKMRITHEADYAIRIASYLAMRNERVGAKEIAEQTGVTLRFALKILRKMILTELVTSFKGVSGGYILSKPAKEVSFGEIIEKIDGPIKINHCLSNEFSCTRVGQKGDCDFHKIFCSINAMLKKELYSVTLDQFTPKD